MLLDFTYPYPAGVYYKQEKNSILILYWFTNFRTIKQNARILLLLIIFNNLFEPVFHINYYKKQLPSRRVI